MPLQNSIIQSVWKDKYICESLKLSQIGITFLLRAVLKNWWWTSLLCSLPGKEPRLDLLFFSHCFPYFPLVMSFPRSLSLTPGCTGCSSSGRSRIGHEGSPREGLSQQNLVFQLWRDVHQSSKGQLNWRHLWQNHVILLLLLVYVSLYPPLKHKEKHWRFWRTFFGHTIFFLRNFLSLLYWGILLHQQWEKKKKEKNIQLTGIEMLCQEYVPWLYLLVYPVLTTSGQQALSL